MAAIPEAVLSDDSIRFYRVALSILKEAEVPALVGGAYAYARYTGVYPNGSTNRDEFELGLNYIIDGHNARISLMYQYGDIATKGLNYSPDASGNEVSAIKLGIQLQI